MIVKELLITLLLFSTTALGALNTASNVVFIKEDTLQLRGEVSDSSVAPLIDAIEKSQVKEMVMYVDSPGGSVTSGMDLVDAVTRNSIKLTCVVGKQAASAAFFILQLACHNRYVSDNSVLYQHNWRVGLPLDTIETHLETLRVTQILFDKIRKREAARLKITVAELLRRSNANWTLLGGDAVNQKAADKVVSLVCSPDIVAKYVDVTVTGSFGPMTVKKSLCPFINAVGQ